MKGSNSALLRAMYIILVPVVALIILLNTGWLQRLLPAAAVHGETFSVVRYNYYYFDYYNSFLEEHEGQLDELGYDPQAPASKQSYDGAITWKEFFQQQAESNLAETAYYCDLAQAAGYEFSQAELAPVEAQLEANEVRRTQYNISANNYYVSYYGVGMNGERYVQELTRQVQAQAYKAYLTRSYEPDQALIAQWLAEYPEDDYRAVHLQVITLEALPDRSTGAVGPEQLAALESKLDKLADRYEQGASFSTLQSAFSTCTFGGPDGVLIDATRADLPVALANWCLAEQDELKPGDTYAYVDASAGTACFAILNGLGDSGPQLDARTTLAAQAIDQAWQEAAATHYQVERSAFGMLLATT